MVQVVNVDGELIGLVWNDDMSSGGKIVPPGGIGVGYYDDDFNPIPEDQLPQIEEDDDA